jgi:AcrR family transcriptional regulator
VNEIGKTGRDTLASARRRRILQTARVRVQAREKGLYSNAQPPKQAARQDKARARILEAAYALFTRHGTRAVGIDTIIEQSGVAKMTLYRHFRSKQELVCAFLERRETLWTFDWLRSEVIKAASDPKDRLMAIFDVFDRWFQHKDFEGCSFINVLLEYDPDSPMRQAAAGHLAGIRSFLKELASEARLADIHAFADTWHILMKGSIVAACEGNKKAAIEAKVPARLLLDNWPRA